MASAPAVAAVEVPGETAAPDQAPRDVAVRFTDVSKAFRIPVDRAYTLEERVLRPRSSRQAHDLEALKDISFEIYEGEFFGVIGRNGSGKSTLLKCLAGIYQPSSGKIEIAGRISPFLELGVGFSPELTARENVVLNASLIGISPKKARASFDDIIAFAELEEFVDLKYKNYSSGMAMRLAFASAIQAEADILLIDEALAVGDDPFKEKCYERFDEMKAQGRTIVFVTHALSLVNRFCDRALLLDKGDAIDLDESRPVVALYQQRNRELAEAAEAAARAAEAQAAEADASGEGQGASRPDADAAPSNGAVTELPIKAEPPQLAPVPAPEDAEEPAVEPEPEPEADGSTEAEPEAVATTEPEAGVDPSTPPEPEPEPAAPPEPEPEPEPEPPPSTVEPPPTLPHVEFDEPPTEPVTAAAHDPELAPPAAEPESALPLIGAATISALWLEDGRGAAPQPVSHALDNPRLHVRVSFPDAVQEPVFGAIVKGATGEPVLVEHSLRDDLKPSAPQRDPDGPYSVRFYVHAGHLLYVASVTIAEPSGTRDQAWPDDDALAFSVWGMKLRSGWGRDLPMFGIPGTPPSASLALGGPGVPTLGDAWLQAPDGSRDGFFYAGHRSRLCTHVTLPGDEVAGTHADKPPEPEYAINLYAYTDTGHYSTTVAVSV